LTVYVVKHMSLSDMLGLCVAWLRGTWRQHSAVTEFETSEIILLAGRRAVRVMNDGEPSLMMTPLRYRIRPGALRVFAPPAA
jgi:diacylglycerol kinase family enzyme